MFDTGSYADELRAAGVPILALPVRSFRSVEAVRSFCRMMRYIRTHRIRLAHAFDKPMAVYGLPAAWLARTQVVLSSQRSSRNLQAQLRPALRLMDKVIDGIVVNGISMRQELVEVEGYPADRIHICYNGIDLCRFPYAPQRTREGQLAGADVVVGVACMLRPEKGLPTLIDAFAKVRREGAGMKLVLVGSGPMRQALEERAREQGVAGDTLLVPVTPDVPRWLRQMDIFVLPSLTESFSNALMEAMASGCCAIASQVGGNAELIEDGRTGLLFPAEDSNALAACLRRVIDNSQLRRDLAERGSRLIHERFARARSVEQLEQIYALFLDRNRHSAG
jgi:glycosyltransferase involved in cell wall biosynthesis